MFLTSLSDEALLDVCVKHLPAHPNQSRWREVFRNEITSPDGSRYTTEIGVQASDSDDADPIIQIVSYAHAADGSPNGTGGQGVTCVAGGTNIDQVAAAAIANPACTPRLRVTSLNREAFCADVAHRIAAAYESTGR